MNPSLSEVLQALQDSWSIDSTDDPENWNPSNPSRGQCGMSSLIINDYFGGKLVLWKVFVGEEQAGVHYSNELPDGTPFDSTGDQFWDTEELKNLYRSKGQVNYQRMELTVICDYQIWYVVSWNASRKKSPSQPKARGI